MRNLLFTCLVAALSLSSCGEKFEGGDFSKVKAGDQVPDFQITDVSGATTFNSRSGGKVVFIYLFWSRCGDCKEATPLIMQLRNVIAKDPALELVCIARGGNEPQSVSQEYWTGAWPASVIPPLYYDGDRSIYNQFATQGVPRFCVVDAEGVIRWHKDGLTSYEEMLAELLLAKVPLEADEE